MLGSGEERANHPRGSSGDPAPVDGHSCKVRPSKVAAAPAAGLRPAPAAHSAFLSFFLPHSLSIIHHLLARASQNGPIPSYQSHTSLSEDSAIELLARPLTAAPTSQSAHRSWSRLPSLCCKIPASSGRSLPLASCSSLSIPRFNNSSLGLPCESSLLNSNGKPGN